MTRCRVADGVPASSRHRFTAARRTTSFLAVLRRILLIALLVAVCTYLVSFIAVVITSRQDERRAADAIVVLGAAQYNGRPSPVLRARLDHSLVLFREGVAPVIIVTGGIGTGDKVSEATVSRRYLVANGVPDSAVVVRPQGRSTLSSIRSVADWARERRVDRVVLVSDPFHMLRLQLEASRVGLKPTTSPTASSPISANGREELLFLLREALKIPVVLLRVG
jgi:uncharacterized SAM-binding protein YcdF (DUF218 family)